MRQTIRVIKKERLLKERSLNFCLADYGLVVICSSENEDRANIVAALDQYRVAAPPCPSPDDLQNYLKRQFRIPPQQYGYINNSKITWAPAGSLDPER